MDTVDMAVSAAVGAVVAVGATYVLKLVVDATSKYDRKIAEEQAYQMGRKYGYAEGQDSVAAQFAEKVTGQTFATR